VRKAALALLLAARLGGAELRSKTVAAFDHYVRLTEARIQSEVADPGRFLWPDFLPEARRRTVYDQLRQGQIVIEELQTREGGRTIPIPDGLVHHRLAVVFIPGATLGQAVGVTTDFDNYQKIYRPDMVRSKLLRKEGNRYQAYLRFFKKKVVTAVLDTEHEIEYFEIDAARGHSRSRATRIAEVDNPDRAEERQRPPGKDRGLLWRLNTYWRFQQKDGGAYAQIESVSLTRDAPGPLDWVMGPFLRAAPREFLYNTIHSTRAALAPAASPGR